MVVSSDRVQPVTWRFRRRRRVTRLARRALFVAMALSVMVIVDWLSRH
jgi:hypothetical protein